MLIIDDLLIWLPAKGFISMIKKIYEMAETEVNDESKLKEQLLRFQTMYEFDQIGEEEYQAREDEIMARLNEIRKRKNSKL